MTPPDPLNPVQPWYLKATPLATVPWLIRLRTVTAVLDLLVLGVALALPQVDFPLRQIAWLVALSAVANAAIALALTRRAGLPRAALATSLVLDVLLLTWLLDLTGGPFNPFAVIYAVHIALAGLTLGRLPAGLVATVAAAGYGVLLFWHAREGVSVHHRINDFPTHLFTMWIATAALAELVVYVVVQASKALEAMRLRATQAEHLASLTTLAAGAAHELSTPLATIALTSRELERAAERTPSAAALIDDARLIRREVDRCRDILDQMSGRAGGSAGDDPEPLDVAVEIAGAARCLPASHAVRLAVDAAVTLPKVFASRAGLRQALLSLMRNAVQASPDGPAVAVTAREILAPRGVRISVRDRGVGMAPEVLARAGEPFFTTKEPGQGLGLGLFLTRVFAERSGGSLSIHADEGTTVMLDLPLATADSPRP